MLENLKNKITHGDCLEIMKQLPDKCIDLILCDLPYGTTACEWDVIIPFKDLWESYTRIMKDTAAIVLTASQPFTSMLVMSNLKMFKYAWVWNKHKAGNIFLANYQPMKTHEDVLIFGKNNTNYYPIKTLRNDLKITKAPAKAGKACGGGL